MSLWSYKRKPTFDSTAVASTAGWRNSATNELLVCIDNTVLATGQANTALTSPTATPATATNVVTGSTITVAATVTGQQIGYYGDEVPYINLTVGANVRKVPLTTPAAKTDAGTLSFVYTVVAGDVAAPSSVTVEGKVYGGYWSVNVGPVRDKVLPSQLTFAAPTTLIRVNTP